ncbi:MAG: hypothetical protein QGI09_08695, partial [Dehalococcoidia bacterium]|nr:hypothetical protein [Dehalococcoidia bacterium]
FALDPAKPPEWYFTTLNVFAVPVALTVAPIESRVWPEPLRVADDLDALSRTPILAFPLTKGEG